MTEAEWLTANDRRAMLDHVCERPNLRKLLLFGVALCRCVWDRLPFRECHETVDVVERLADHPRLNDEDYALVKEADDLGERLRQRFIALPHSDEIRRSGCLGAILCGGLWHDTVGMIGALAHSVAIVAVGETEGPALDLERHAQATLLHDVFGNPFRPFTFSPAWRTETAVALATGIYAERAFDRMPILADALEEVGCDSADVLSHCRGTGPHVRGCWVVDAVLGKG